MKQHTIRKLEQAQRLLIDELVDLVTGGLGNSVEAKYIARQVGINSRILSESKCGAES